MRRTAAAEGRGCPGRHPRGPLLSRRDPRGDRSSPAYRQASGSRSTCSSSLLAALANQGAAFTAAGHYRPAWATSIQASRPTSCALRGPRACPGCRQRSAVRRPMRGTSPSPTRPRCPLCFQRCARASPPRAASNTRGTTSHAPRRRVGLGNSQRQRPGRSCQRHLRGVAMAQSLGLDPIVEVPRPDGTLAKLALIRSASR